MSLDPGQVLDLFTFVVGPHRYAIDVRRVDEVLAPAEVTPLPGARAPVDGLLSLRGGPVPRVDLRLCLPAGDPPAGSEPGSFSAGSAGAASPSTSTAWAE